MLSKKFKRDFTEGPLFFRITLFALPIMLTGILQTCYNMADHIVVGQFSGNPHALDAVGSTSSLTSLIVNLLLGISGGPGVVVAQLYGARDDKRLSRAVHTAMCFSLIGGIFVSAVGLAVSSPVLRLMGTKPEIFDLAVLYLRIICIGIPANSVYNFGASILRSTGDSRTPLIILASTGIINVILNLVFVILLGMSVEGVAMATIIAQYLSAVSVVTVLSRKKGEPYGFSFKNICFDKELMLKIFRYGVPAGVQGCMFSIGNVLMTSAVNTLPTTTVTANTIAGNIDAITYTSMNSFAQASMTFVGQNYGAMKKDRIKKSIIYCIIQVFVVGAMVSGTELIFRNQLIGLFLDSSAPEADIIAKAAYELITFLLSTYLICGLMDVVSGALKGLGYAMTPMLISISCICGVRIFWIYAIFPIEAMHTITGLFAAYPVSWSLALIGMITALVIAYRRLMKKTDKE